jgi:hypothetical protein
MKKFAILLVFVSMLQLANAGIDSYHECSHKACLEGTAVNFTVSVYNNLKESITVDDVYIKDVETNKILAIDVRKEQIILQNDEKTFILKSVVLAPSRGYTFYYVPCFKAKAFNESGLIGQRTICGKVIKSLTVVPLDKVECRTDRECSDDNYCNTNSLYKCRQLNCRANQTIENHKCVELSCNTIQYANDHKCVYNKYLLAGIVITGLIIVCLSVAGMHILRPKRRVKHK